MPTIQITGDNIEMRTEMTVEELCTFLETQNKTQRLIIDIIPKQEEQP